MLRRFEIFDKKFCDEGGFNKKLFEAYRDNGEWYDPDDEEDYYDDTWLNTNKYSKMITNINFEKLSLMGLLEYQDIVEKAVEYFEKQISSGSFGETITPPLDAIQDYIIGIVGNDYKEYISEEKLDQLTRFIYQEIDNYIFD